MKKENNQEFYVEQMDVHYPLQSEIQNEIEEDLSRTWIKSHLL